MAQWEKALCLGGSPFRGSVWDRQHYDTKVNHCLNETEYILIIFWFSVYLWMVGECPIVSSFPANQESYRYSVECQWRTRPVSGLDYVHLFPFGCHSPFAHVCLKNCNLHRNKALLDRNAVLSYHGFAEIQRARQIARLWGKYSGRIRLGETGRDMPDILVCCVGITHNTKTYPIDPTKSWSECQ